MEKKYLSKDIIGKQVIDSSAAIIGNVKDVSLDITSPNISIVIASKMGADLSSSGPGLMVTHICDRCGRPILKGEPRYVARIEVFAAADPLEISAEDLARDASDEIEALLSACEQLSEEELMRDVYVYVDELQPGRLLQYLKTALRKMGGPGG
jgi:sporulation protein YlmC with PRC-barrel domain